MACRVFIADDLEVMRALWRAVLEEDSDMVVVGEAGDGDAALAGVDKTRPDVLLLDLLMPGKDGLEVLELLRAEGRELPVVVVASALDAGRMSRRVFELGAVAYFEKASPLAELTDVVKRAWKLAPQHRAA